MISLRSHAISLAAVFLALAIGVALGSGLLSNTVLSGLRADKSEMQTQIDSLTEDKNALNEKLSAAGDFDAQMAPRILRDSLAEKTVILFHTPDATDGDVEALTRLVDLLPDIFRVHWAAHVHRSTGIVHATDAAPGDLEFTEITRARRLDAVDGDVAVYAAARLDGNQIIIVGRRGGPEFVDSEIARLGHLCGVAAQIARI